MRHTRVVSFSSAGEASVEFPAKAGLPDHSDVHSIVDVSLFGHHSTVASVNADQDSQQCLAIKTKRSNAYRNERDEVSIFQNDNSNGRLPFNVIDDVADPSFLSVPMADVYLDFVNDNGDELLDFPAHDHSFEV